MFRPRKMLSNVARMLLRYAWSIFRSGRRCIYGRRVALDYGSVFSKRPNPKPPAVSAHHLPTGHVHSHILDLILQNSPFANQLARIGHLHTNHSIGTPCENHYSPISSLRRCYRSYNRSIITRRSAITPIAASEDVVSELKKAQQGSRELLPQGHNTSKLHIRYAALDGVVRCSCKAAAVFDSEIYCESTWSETTAQPGDRASTSPKVAVGLEDGTVHFMELCRNNVSPLCF
jgi:hypothetical protein